MAEPPGFAGCLQAFASRDYAACIKQGLPLLSQATPQLFQLLLISIQRQGQLEWANRLGSKALTDTAAQPWTNALLRLTLGQLPPSVVLDQAGTDEQRCQAHYYAGARLLTEGQPNEAREHFLACLALPECLERELAQVECPDEPAIESRGADIPVCQAEADRNVCPTEVPERQDKTPAPEQLPTPPPVEPEPFESPPAPSPVAAPARHQDIERCFAAFTAHHHADCIAQTEALIQSGIPEDASPLTLFQVLLISLVRSEQRGQLATMGAVLLRRVSNPWHILLLKITLGQAGMGEALSEARTDEQRCQMNYYVGAARLAAGDAAAAEHYFRLCQQTEAACPELTFATADLAELERARASVNDQRPEVASPSVPAPSPQPAPEARDPAAIVQEQALAALQGGAYPEAERLLRELVDLRLQAVGEQHPDLAFALQNLAKLYLETRNYLSAEALFRQALEIHRAAGLERDPALIPCLLGLGSACIQLAKLAEAEPLLTEAVALAQQHPGGNMATLASAERALQALREAQERAAAQQQKSTPAVTVPPPEQMERFDVLLHGLMYEVEQLRRLTGELREQLAASEARARRSGPPGTLRPSLAPPPALAPAAPPPRWSAPETAPLSRSVGKSAASASPPSRARRATVRYYSQMSPRRAYPLLVVLAGGQVQSIVVGGVEQAASELFQIQEGSRVEIEPILPGCHCFPPRQEVVIQGEVVKARFHVIPDVEGAVPEPVVLLRQYGRLLAQVPLQMWVGKQTPAKVLGVLAFVLPYVLKYFKLDIDSQLQDNFGPALQLLFRLLAALAALPWWLTAGALGAAALGLWWWYRPRPQWSWEVELSGPGENG